MAPSPASPPVAVETSRSQTLHMDGYDAHVTYKPVKRLRMRIRPPDGEVAVSAPMGTPVHVIRTFLLAQHSWVLRHRASLRLSPSRSAALVTGGRVRLWGTWREVVVHDSAATRAREVGGDVHVWRPDDDADAAARAVEALHHRETGAATEQLLAVWEPRVGRHAAGTRLRRMTSRWGSCNTVTGMITFNTALAEYPLEALEFVVVHELVHLVERGHGPVFIGHMDRLLPDWRSRRRLLREVS